MEIKEIIGEPKDELLDDVITFFDNSDQPITLSTIQRKFQLGYNRAYKIVRQMETEFIEKRESILRQNIGEFNKSAQYFEKLSLIDKQLSEIRTIFHLL
ncbi:MAG: DNA translocase FtsK [Fusobacteriaceae bacterium]